MGNAARQHNTTPPIHAILDRWAMGALHATVCRCAPCNDSRAQTFRCDNCGYVGPTWVWACECPEIAQKDLRHYLKLEAAVKAGETTRHPFDSNITGKRAVLADLRKLIARERKEVAEGYHAFNDPHCTSAHGSTTECPVCLNGDPGTVTGPENAWSIIRDLRRELAYRRLLG